MSRSALPSAHRSTYRDGMARHDDSTQTRVTGWGLLRLPFETKIVEAAAARADAIFDAVYAEAPDEVAAADGPVPAELTVVVSDATEAEGHGRHARA